MLLFAVLEIHLRNQLLPKRKKIREESISSIFLLFPFGSPDRSTGDRLRQCRQRKNGKPIIWIVQKARYSHRAFLFCLLFECIETKWTDNSFHLTVLRRCFFSASLTEIHRGDLPFMSLVFHIVPTLIPWPPSLLRSVPRILYQCIGRYAFTLCFSWAAERQKRKT